MLGAEAAEGAGGCERPGVTEPQEAANGYDPASEALAAALQGLDAAPQGLDAVPQAEYEPALPEAAHDVEPPAPASDLQSDFEPAYVPDAAHSHLEEQGQGGQASPEDPAGLPEELGQLDAAPQAQQLQDPAGVPVSPRSPEQLREAKAAVEVAKAAVTAAVIEEVNQGLANGSGSRTCVIS